MSRFTISVALVTRNRPESLERALRSWRKQSVRPFEIVVSDDSDDANRLGVRRIASRFDARWIPGPRRGLYANRNHVALSCEGTHILSADDDHEHPEDFVARCLDALDIDPQSAWCIGEVDSWSDFGRAWTPPGALRLDGASSAPRDRSHTWAWSDGAALCPRQVFDSGLRFSEAFRFGAAYLEFGCLLHAVGQRIRILDTTGVIHHMGEVGRSYSIPIEEGASRCFAVLMLGTVYQPSLPHYCKTSLYFVKQLLRHPWLFPKMASWGIKETRKRAAWLREWKSSDGPQRLRVAFHLHTRA
jgi:glycosyltransferase involved in cell wall biosynthesis